MSRRMWFLLIGAGVFFAAIVANYQALALTAAIILDEDRPDLLRDAVWGEPESAKSFRQKFPAGTPEADLLEWLETNDFEIHAEAGVAEKRVRSLPCNELIQVGWSIYEDGLIVSAEAKVMEAGCL